MPLTAEQAIARLIPNEERYNDFINASGTYTTSSGTQVKTLPRVVADILARYLVVSRGAWVTGYAYVTNDLVLQGGVYYICVVAHTSGTFATDLSAVRWLVYSIGANPTFDTVNVNSSIGVGVTPTANPTASNIELQSGFTLFGAFNNGYIGGNAVFDGAWKYKANGGAARFELGDFGLKMFAAPTGTAGAAISWTQVAAFDTSTITMMRDLQLGAYALRWNQTGVRSWEAQATGGNLQIGSGDGLGALRVNTHLTLKTDPAAWGSGFTAIQLPGSGSLSSGNSFSNIYLANNLYNDGSTWRFNTTGAAALYGLGTDGAYYWYSAPSGTGGAAASSLTESMRVTQDGTLLVGASSGTYHRLARASASEGTTLAGVDNGTSSSLLAYSVGAEGFNTSASAVKLGQNTTTNRSLNAGGTINASGADYAEYMLNGGFRFTKGDIVGVGASGVLTPHWVQATRFKVKSTAPCMVGGDSWAQAAGPAPVEPQFVAPEYLGASDPGEAPATPQPALVVAEGGALVAQPPSAEALAEWEAACAAYAALRHTWTMDQAEHAARVEVARNLFDVAIWPEYVRARDAHAARVEELRQGVDRMAFCGIVPCNVTEAKVGDYIVPAEGPKGTIIGIAVPDADITFTQFRKAVGKVHCILPDGRAAIDVLR